MNRCICLLGVLCCVFVTACRPVDRFYPGELWEDKQGVHINAHGGGMLYAEGRYYWFGEYKSEHSNAALKGVSCYSSKDLYHWKNEGIVLSVEEDLAHPLVKGCVIERPKVVYNAKTGKYVLWFHHELRGMGYSAAMAGVAVSEQITGPYRYLGSCRPNAGIWPQNLPSSAADSIDMDLFLHSKSWTSEWMAAVKAGAFVKRDFPGGQMARDMTVFVDEDGTAYHIYASEENLTLQIAELSDDYTGYTGRYIRILPGAHNEAPAMFKKDGMYYMITSGCTGWEPNAARLLSAPSIWGPWIQSENPWQGEKAQTDVSYRTQSTYVFPVQGYEDAFILMTDRWNPNHPSDGRYVWQPIVFEAGKPVLYWQDAWSWQDYVSSKKKTNKK